MELEFNEQFLKDKHLKSFIRVGLTFIDIKHTVGFSFIDDPNGYIIIQFIYDTGKAINAFLRDRNDFAQFLLELDPFIDDPIALQSMEEFINEIELTCKQVVPLPKKRGRKPKQPDNEC